MKLLFLGNVGQHSSSLDRARALGRNGHQVELLDPLSSLAPGRLMNALHYRTGYRFVRRRIEQHVLARLGEKTFPLIWVDDGRAVSPRLVRRLKQTGARVLNYNLDDPFGRRDGRCWDTYLASVREYDLVCVVRDANVAEAQARGARRVFRVWRTYDPVSHRPRRLAPGEAPRWASEVLFVGTWMPERGPFLTALLDAGIPLSLYGNRWEKAPEWPRLRAVWRGGGLVGTAYVAAIQSAKICLGLLSKGNRDEHTQRSAEVPFIGSLLCAERTREHQMMYLENREALFWSDAEECAEQCRRALADDRWRETLRAAGRSKVRRLQLSNDEAVRRIVEAALQSTSASPAPWPAVDQGTLQALPEMAAESARRQLQL